MICLAQTIPEEAHEVALETVLDNPEEVGLIAQFNRMMIKAQHCRRRPKWYEVQKKTTRRLGRSLGPGSDDPEGISPKGMSAEGIGPRLCAGSKTEEELYIGPVLDPSELLYKRTDQALDEEPHLALVLTNQPATLEPSQAVAQTEEQGYVFIEPNHVWIRNSQGVWELFELPQPELTTEKATRFKRPLRSYRDGPSKQEETEPPDKRRREMAAEPSENRFPTINQYNALLEQGRVSPLNMDRHQEIRRQLMLKEEEAAKKLQDAFYEYHELLKLKTEETRRQSGGDSYWSGWYPFAQQMVRELEPAGNVIAHVTAQSAHYQL